MKIFSFIIAIIFTSCRVPAENDSGYFYRLDYEINNNFIDTLIVLNNTDSLCIYFDSGFDFYKNNKLSPYSFSLTEVIIKNISLPENDWKLYVCNVGCYRPLFSLSLSELKINRTYLIDLRPIFKSKSIDIGTYNVFLMQKQLKTKSRIVFWNNKH